MSLLGDSSLYSTKIQKGIKLISLFAFILLLISNFVKIYSIIKNNYSDQLSFLVIVIIINFLLCNICVVLLFFPSKLELISICSILYSYIIVWEEAENPVSIFLFILGIVLLLFRGFFNRGKKVKLILTIGSFILYFVIPLRLGLYIFVQLTLYKIGVVFVAALIFLFLFYYIQAYINKKQALKMLNIAKYSNLNVRDSEWLILLQQNKIYKEIASISNLKEGSVRNRFQIIFETLEVGDKTGFLNKYGEYQIIFDTQTLN